MKLLREYTVALQFFTGVPVNGALAQWAGWSPEMLLASVRDRGRVARGSDDVVDEAALPAALPRIYR